MSEQDQINQLAQQEEADIAALKAQVPTLQNGLNALEAAIQGLQTQQPALDLSAITQAQADLHSGLAALQGITIPAPPAAPAPAPAPAAPAAEAPASAEVATDANGKPLYEYKSADPIDGSVWILSDSVTASDGSALYTYVSDAAGQPPTAASAQWVPYTGATVPKAAPTA